MSSRQSFESDDAASQSFASGALRQPVDASARAQHAISIVMRSASQATLFSPSQLSALNPLRSTAGPKTSSTRGKPAAHVPLSELPAVQKADFEPYLEQVGSEYERWLESKRLGLTGKPQFDSTVSTSKKLGKLPSLDVVPELYKQEDFDLTLPRFFEAVTQARTGDELHASSSQLSLEDLASDQMLQEHLSHYLDIVEQHLAVEISARSASFFSALSNLQSLHAQSQVALDRIASLKTSLQSVDDQKAKKGLGVIRLDLRRGRLHEVSQAVERLKEVWRATQEAAELATHGEWEGALGIVEELDAAYHNASDPTLRLDKLAALRTLPDQLASLRSQIGKSLQSELVSVLLHELEEQLKLHEDASVPWESYKAKEQAAEVVRPLVRGLVRCGPAMVGESITSWKDAIWTHVKQTIRAGLPLTNDIGAMAVNEDDSFTVDPRASMDSSTDRSMALAKALQDLSHEDFMVIVRKEYHQLVTIIQIVEAHVQVLSSLVEDATKTVAPSNSANQDLDEILYTTAELANQRFAKVIKIRSDQHAALPIKDFVELTDESWSFVNKCESICHRMIVGLRGILLTQSKAFLQHFHQTKITQSAKVVEEELWAAVDIPLQTQQVVQLIIDAAVADPPELVFKSAESAVVQHQGASSAKQLDIEGRNYFAVLACLKCLDGLLDYLRLVINVSMLTTECMSRVIEYLKQFNSRTCQVVLGAGAMRSAGLKNITAKHLALASQCLSILISLIPYVRELIRRHLNPKQAVMLVEFDKLKRDYQDHQNEIYAKLVAIMGDRLIVHCKSLQAVDWSKPSEGVSPYMEALTKETTTLHKVLSRYMPGQPLELVMMQVMSAITTRLAEEYSKLQLPDQAAKERVLVDARWLKSKLTDLKGLERTAPGAQLEELIKDLPTQEQTQPRKESAELPKTKPEVDVPPPTPEKEALPATPTKIDTTVATPITTTQSMTSSPVQMNNQQNVKNRLGALFQKASMRRTSSGSSLPDPTRKSLETPRGSIDGTMTSMSPIKEGQPLPVTVTEKASDPVSDTPPAADASEISTLANTAKVAVEDNAILATAEPHEAIDAKQASSEEPTTETAPPQTKDSTLDQPSESTSPVVTPEADAPVPALEPEMAVASVASEQSQSETSETREASVDTSITAGPTNDSGEDTAASSTDPRAEETQGPEPERDENGLVVPSIIQPDGSTDDLSLVNEDTEPTIERQEEHKAETIAVEENDMIEPEGDSFAGIIGDATMEQIELETGLAANVPDEALQGLVEEVLNDRDPAGV